MALEDLAAFSATGESLGKAGACGIQGRGRFPVQALRGAYVNGVGLPLCRPLGSELPGTRLPGR